MQTHLELLQEHELSKQTRGALAIQLDEAHTELLGLRCKSAELEGETGRLRHALATAHAQTKLHDAQIDEVRRLSWWRRLWSLRRSGYYLYLWVVERAAEKCAQ